MGFIEDELTEVKSLCENVIEGSRLVSCVRSVVRVEIKRTLFKALVICFQFPEDYPKCPILIELKSKTFSSKLLEKLSNICEQEAKKYINKAQILVVVKFLKNFVDENPLACCYDEITDLKLKLSGSDELKLKQKSSTIILKVFNQKYYLESKIFIPDDYPQERIEIQDLTTNFSPALNRHIIAQAKEIARKCVEPPVKQNKNDPPFKPNPSLKKSVEFLITCVKSFPSEQCQICKKNCLPEDPALLELDENSSSHIERIYCGHLLHLECLVSFMKTPPFGNKKCSVCGVKINHHKWTLTDKLAENRWAHEQARERELEEVTDFFK
ncbi:hypothetical protein WA026_009926 [Henosepilachna vigintioctopunctata]|uniref:RWD domain-containing protein n=1 Tax=Henosepilachna vigintioctopunctata TaxID=420089 RepID=A0AAW1TKH4_9CUCU